MLPLQPRPWVVTQDFHFGPDTATVYTRAAPKSTFLLLPQSTIGGPAATRLRGALWAQFGATRFAVDGIQKQ